jgi:hypothetical protein
MNIENLLSEVRTLRSKGIKRVDLERLEDALVATSKATSSQDEWNIKVAELKHQSDLAGHVAAQEMSRTLLNAAITFAGAALKSALLINGGAAVAMLAYLGNSHSETNEEFPYALLMFTSGVLLAAMATGGSYLAQTRYAKRTESNEQAKRMEVIGNRYRNVSIALIIVAYIAFGLGSFTAYFGFI